MGIGAKQHGHDATSSVIDENVQLIWRLGDFEYDVAGPFPVSETALQTFNFDRGGPTHSSAIAPSRTSFLAEQRVLAGISKAFRASHHNRYSACEIRDLLEREFLIVSVVIEMQ